MDLPHRNVYTVREVIKVYYVNYRNCKILMKARWIGQFGGRVRMKLSFRE